MGRGEEGHGGGKGWAWAWVERERVNRTSMVATNLTYNRMGGSGLYMELEM